MTNTLVKSKQRTVEFGEVFTSKEIVDSMINLIDEGKLSIESRFLEPACGNGNFLYEILDKKLKSVEDKYKKDQNDYERYSILAVSSMYGIDILDDNVLECRKRLLDLYIKRYTNLFKSKINNKSIRSVGYILDNNIIIGDALSLKISDKSEKPIVFSEWSFINSTMIKRRDYTLANLIEYRPFESDTLFSDAGNQVVIPKTIKEYPLIHYLDLI
jgi:hypothetical protein|tara:strand:+ start:257 stop:901 length:645 start_codon:yes stop_codon:yes gene_type:complete